MQKFFQNFYAKTQKYSIQKSEVSNSKEKIDHIFKQQSWLGTIDETVNNKDEVEAENKIIEELIKEIEDNNVRDLAIIEKIQALVADKKLKADELRDYRFGKDGLNLIHLIASKNRPKICKFMLDNYSFDVNSQTKNKMTALHLLIDSFDINAQNEFIELTETFNVFFEKNFNINLQNNFKSTLLHSAIKKQNFTAVSMLVLQEKLDLALEDQDGLTPLQLACKHDNEEITRLIINRIICDNLTDLLSHDSFRLSPICLTVLNRHEKFNTFSMLYFKLKELNLTDNLLDRVNEENQTLLELAVENNHLQIVDMLLYDYAQEKKEEYDQNGNQIMHICAKYGSQELFDILSKHNAISFEPNKSNNENALHIAASFNRFDFIKALLAYEKEKLKKAFSTQKPMVLLRNKNNYTPLQVAIAKKRERCVKELIASNEIETDLQENENNYSIYHLCILNSDFESLNMMLNRREKKFYEPLFLKSKQNETPMHLAFKLGYMEPIKLMTNKINTVAVQDLERYLKETNNDGRTCFHLACIFGHYNIIKYFLKQLRMEFFIETCDNDLNTCLLLAALNGHDRIVEILLDSDANIKAKNKENETALEISCRKGHFETSKIIIDKLDSCNEDINYFDGKTSLLHLATREGAYEIVELLLKRGAHIDRLDENNENCLDLAIEKEYKDVIRVLLKDKNWLSLFQTNSISDKNARNFEESKQIKRLVSKKMWDMIQLLLDNCELRKTNELDKHIDKCYDLRVLDPKYFSGIDKHPLLMIANSGQEQLLAHSTILTLLELKWKKIPRLLYIFNISIHLLFLVLFTVFSFDLIEINRMPENSNVNGDDDNLYSVYNPYLFTVMSMILVSMIFKIALSGVFNYLLKIDSWILITKLILSFLSVTSNNLSVKITLCSISIILVYLHFAFLIQKLKFFGLYVLAFKSTVKNSAKFFPIFMLIYAGFIFSFRVRTGTSDIQYFNDTTSEVFIKGLTLMLGNFNDDQMGLKSSAINYILYALFIFILSIIILNLFVGIAVGEITQLLAKATIQQVSLRIIFVIQIQYAIKFFNRFKFLERMLNMTYGYYDYKKDENKCMRFIDKFLLVLRLKFNKANPTIDLVDSLTTIDNKVDELFVYFKTENLRLKSSLFNQLDHLDGKMSASLKQLGDSLRENSRRALGNMEFSNDSRIEKDVNDNERENSELDNEINIYQLRNEFETKIVCINDSFTKSFQEFEMNLFKQQDQLLDILKKINDNSWICNEQSIKHQSSGHIDPEMIYKNFQLLNMRFTTVQNEIDLVVNKIETLTALIKYKN